jgi:regulator of sigma E protease
MALFIFWIAYMIGPPSYQVSIPQVMPDSPAEAAGLRPGDVILQVNGIPVNGSEVVIEEVSGSAGVPVEFVVLRNQAHFWIGLGIGGVGVPGEFVVLRDQQKISIVVTPRVPGEYNPETDGPTGIQLSSIPTGENVSYGPVRSLVMSGEMIFEIIYRTLQAPVMLIQGQISPAEARPVSVVGISQLAGRAAEETATQGDLFPLLWFSGIISVALGFTNLLPIPALDGGRIMFVLIEAIRGRRVEPEREGMVHLVGMLVLLGLMVLIIIQDIINPVIPF